MADDRPAPLVVMGVQGSGKSTVGQLLAERLGRAGLLAEFVDADDLHPPANVTRMAAGTALTDADRLPWLRAVGEVMREVRSSDRPIVVACSALRRSYRDVLREAVRDVQFVHLTGSLELLTGRLSARQHEFMPATLLDSQLATLEPLDPDEGGLVISIDGSPALIVDRVLSSDLFG